MPADVAERFVACPMTAKPKVATFLGKQRSWRTPAEFEPTKPGWDERVGDGLAALKLGSEWQFTAIDVRKLENGEHAYLYLSNGTATTILQPWSSSKFIAAASAVTTMRKAGIGADSFIGRMHFGDLVSTSMHGFRTKTTPAGSNDVGTWFQNVAGRDNSNHLVRQWLGRRNESFGGGYGKVLQGEPSEFRDQKTGKRARVYNGEVGRSESKLSTLSMAELLRRLAASGTNDPSAWPGLTEGDARIILYGSPMELGGLLAGIDGYVRQALGRKAKLDARTMGRWRIFGKMGAAELHVGDEQIVNAYVCLPGVDGGRAFFFSLANRGRVGKEGDVRMQRGVDALVRALVPAYFD